MKQPAHSSPLRYTGLAAGLLALLAGPLAAQTSFTWDPNHDGSGGNGTWGDGSDSWRYVDPETQEFAWGAWTDNSLYTVSFLRNTTGEIEVEGTRTLRAITFSSEQTASSTSYTLNGGILDIRQSSGAGSGHAINSQNGTHVINSTIRLFGSGSHSSTNSINIISGSLTLGNIHSLHT